MSHERHNRQWVLASRPEGEPDMENFELVEGDIPTVEPRDVLVRTVYLSVDPYMRGRMRDRESYAEPWDVGAVMRAGVVGAVVESEHPKWDAGDIVTGNLEWADYSVIDGDSLVRVDPELAPISTALGVIGMPGRTAYFGLLDVGEPKPGETVVVSGGAGAVGSVAGQIARIAGCHVVGIAGSDAKCDWLRNDLGFDAAINYTVEDVHGSLGEKAPEGVDVYFDNVGGEITDAVMDHINLRARVAVCGQIALYNIEGTPTGPRHFWSLIENRARVEGFLIRDYANRYREANERLAAWVRRGEIEYRETITEGLENAPVAFLGLFEGENIGKQLVKVSDEPDFSNSES